MVVYTPDQALNPPKKEQSDDGVDIEIQMEKAALTGDNCDEEHNNSVYNETTIPVVRERRHQKQKRRLWVQLILIIGMLVGLTLCILGSIHLYRGMYTAKYKGRCGVGVVDLPVVNATKPEALKSGTDYYVTSTDKAKPVKCNLYEDVEILGLVETLKVPAQNSSSPATFRHDFSRNMTAIKDDLLELCFLVPFLQDFKEAQVPSPADFSLFLSDQLPDDKLPLVSERDEFFNVDNNLINDVLADFGENLNELCSGVKSYRIFPVAPRQPARVLETTALPETTWATHNPVDVWYKMYPGGDALFNYHLTFIGDTSYEL